MSVSFKLPVFEGPLDLLLHLIEKNQVDIYEIPIVEITRQYLEYVQALAESDLDDISEFVIMAATLLSIKSRMLLPAEEDAPAIARRIREPQPQARADARPNRHHQYDHTPS